MTTWPSLAVYLLALGTPVLSFAGVMWAASLSRRGTKELERRSKREETLRTLRWAAELAVDESEEKRKLGVAELIALLESPLLDENERGFIDAALDAALEDVLVEIESTALSVDDVDVVVIASEDVPSEVEREEVGDDGEG